MTSYRSYGGPSLGGDSETVTRSHVQRRRATTPDGTTPATPDDVASPALRHQLIATPCES